MDNDTFTETSSKDSGTGDSAKRSDDDLIIRDGKVLPNRHSIALGAANKQYIVQPVAWPCRTRSADELVNSSSACYDKVPTCNDSLVPKDSWPLPSSHGIARHTHQFSTFPRKAKANRVASTKNPCSFLQSGHSNEGLWSSFSFFSCTFVIW